MKTLLKFVIGFLMLLVVGFGAVMYFTRGMDTATNDFFQKIQDNQIEVAYQDLSEGFRKNTSVDQLTAFLKTSGLSETGEMSWSSRSRDGGTGVLKGSVTTKSGGTVPLEVHLVQEQNKWRIAHLNIAPSGVAKTASANTARATYRAVPSNDELVSLVKESTAAFGASLDAKNMQGFHEHISSLWSSQYDVAKLEEAYGKLYKLDAKWSSLAKLSPVFEETPIVDPNGALSIKGYYPTKPDLLTFRYSYMIEGLEWKLVGLNVHLKKPPAKGNAAAEPVKP